MVKSGLENFFLEIPPFAHHVIFITEFVLLIKTPHFYEAFEAFDRKWLEHGGISKIFFLDHILSKTSTTSTMSFLCSTKVAVFNKYEYVKTFLCIRNVDTKLPGEKTSCDIFYLHQIDLFFYCECIKLTSFFL